MTVIKKALPVILALFLFVVSVTSVFAQNKDVNLYFFGSKTCPHCAKEKAFLEKIEPQYPNLTIHSYEISNGINDALLLQKIGAELGINIGGVPITFIGESHLIGYLSDQTTGAQIISLIEHLSKEGDPDVVGKVIDSLNNSPSPKLTPTPTPVPTQVPTAIPVELPESLNLPFVGPVVTEDLSLPTLTFVIALLDGFNPCAMWVLLFLISMLLGMKDRMRMWVLGFTFILVSAFVYFLFLSAWLNLFLFLGFVFWVRIIVGIVALTAGVYQLRDYVINKDAACKTTGGEKRQKVFNKIKDITQNKKFLLALLGIMVLAFGVNLIELVCSAGLPAVYTQVLALSHLPRWQYYLYLLFYIFIFMIDDLFVFVVAMVSLNAVGLESKYARYSRLVGGIIIITIGILMLFKPELLMFAK